VLLEERCEVGRMLFENVAGYEHADRLAADESGADHPPPDVQDVLDGQIAGDELEHPQVT